VQWDVTADVLTGLNNGQTRFGWSLLGSNGPGHIDYYSREGSQGTFGDSSRAPGLILQFAAIDLVDFRGTNPCTWGDGDSAVLGTSVNSFVVIDNPYLFDVQVTQLLFSNGQFSTSTPPFTLAGGGSHPISLTFTPTQIGIVTGTLEILGSSGPLGFVDLIGEGLPDEPPSLGVCGLTPNPASLGNAVTLTVDASDSATLANIASCTATGVEQVSGQVVFFTLVDDGSTIGDLVCDGVFTHTQFIGGSFGLGTWDFSYECVDKQGNLSGGGPTCTLVVQ
jgi:hypothetical protein